MRINARECAGITVAVILLMMVSLGGCPGLRSAAERPTRLSPVERLAAQLRDTDWQRRADAAHKLGASREPGAVAPLTRAAGDLDKRVRLAVVKACGVHRSPKLIPALEKGLADKERPVRIQAVRALAFIGTRKAVQAMVETLDGASMWLRPEVADGLAKLPVKILSGLEMATQTLVAELDPSKKARFHRLTRALAAIGDPALGALLRGMYRPAKDPDANKHPASYACTRAPWRDTKCVLGPCRALVQIGKRLLPRLVRLSKDGVQGIDNSVLQLTLLPVIFEKIGCASIPHLLPLLGRPNKVGIMAEAVMSKLAPAAVQPLARLLHKPGQSSRLRVWVVRLLGAVKTKRAVDILLASLKDPTAAVAETAAWALAQNLSDSVFTALAKRIKNGTKAERLAIVSGASDIKAKRATTLLHLVLVQGGVDEAVKAARALGARGDKKAVPGLILALKGRSNKVRRAVVRALARLGDKRATPALIRVARARGDLELRKVAIRSLGYLKGEKAYKALARLTRHGNKTLRLAAIITLGDLGTKPAKKLLKRLKRSRDKTIAKAAANALNPSSLGISKIGVPACDAFLKAFTCCIGKIPSAERGPEIAAFKKTFQNWRKIASESGGASLGKICQDPLNALRKNMSQKPRFRGCFGP